MSFPLPTSLSPSKVSAFKDCPLAFRYSAIDKLPEPPSPWTVKGTLVHRVLELLFWEAGPGHRTPALAAQLLERAWAELEDDAEFCELALSIDEQLEFRTSAQTLIDNYFAIEDPNQINAIGVELHLEAEVGGVTLRGIIDRLDLTHEGDLVITDYKGLAIDTALPTPTGWTTMGEVAVGDRLIGADGRPTTVIAKSQTHWRRCYRITFDDATDIVCDNEHLWQVDIGARPRRITKVVNADELFHMWSDSVSPITIPNTKPLELPACALPIDPYVLGLWLGDGSSRRGYIYANAADTPHLLEQLVARGERPTDQTWPREAARGMRVISVGQPIKDACIRGHSDRYPQRPDGRRGDCRACSRDGDRGFPANGTLYQRLKALGIDRDVGTGGRSKFARAIPAQYLRASIDQRIELLRGLMDSDGYWDSGRKQAVFSTVNAALATGVADLVCSLGGRAYVYSEPCENRHGNQTKYQVIFTPVGFTPFHLPRKASGCEMRTGPARAGRRAIRSIEVVPTVPTQCVAVDAPDSLYLAGRQMVPTHNTGRAPKAAYENGRLGGVQFYAFLCERIFGQRPKQIQLLHLAEPVAIVSTPSEQTTRGLEQRAAAIWRAIERACEREDFRPKPSALCQYCAYQSLCPAFAGDQAVKVAVSA